MNVRFNAERLALEMVVRGWNKTDLAQFSACSVATISAALRGQPVSVRTAWSIGKSLEENAGVEGMASLLVDPTVDGPKLIASSAGRAKDGN
jgi:hypothetical protein